MANNLKSEFTHEDDLFYFESDHLALKGNKDYCEVLKTLVILSAQRKQAIKDFKKIVEIRKHVLEHPVDTLEKIQNGEDLGLPAMMELPKLPVINFKNFSVDVPEEDLKTIYSDSTGTKTQEDCVPKQIKSNHKAWTAEEQKRLEELLVTYPPEPVEMRRFQKIARALGNRTVQQVSSRVQKYFLKLYKAGLPIPGRIPKSSEKYKKSVLHKHQRHNHYLWKPTTFFPDLYVPVMMNDLDNIPGPSLNISSPSTSTSGSANYLIPTEYHHNPDIQLTKTDPEMQLDLLKRIRMEKVKEEEGNYNQFRHVGYRCDYCDVEPIIGPRWHCMACNDSVDYCTDCVLSQMYSDNVHPLHHTLGIFYNDTENPSLPFSDSDSYSGSTTTKNYESDSNNSGEFDTSSNYENVLQYETNSCGNKLNNTQCVDFNYENMSDLVSIGDSKNNSTLENDNYNYLHTEVFEHCVK